MPGQAIHRGEQGREWAQGAGAPSGRKQGQGDHREDPQSLLLYHIHSIQEEKHYRRKPTSWP